jgi:prophage antirepressor-like protein
MNEIKVFQNEQFGQLRAMLGHEGEPLMMGTDVAKRLGYKNPAKALRDHVDTEDKLTERIVLSGQRREVIFINESGLYSLILSSKLPQAKAFKRWVTAEVLPQIRRTGGYIPTHDAEGRQLSNEEILLMAQKIIGKTLRMLNAPTDNCLTATEVAKSWGMDVTSFNGLLHRMGIQHRAHGRWQLREELKGLGLAQDRHFLYYTLHGQQKSRTYLVWTPEGVRFLNERFLNSDWQSPKLVQLNLFIN